MYHIIPKYRQILKRIISADRKYNYFLNYRNKNNSLYVYICYEV